MAYFFSIFFGTFVLEDLALASSLALVAGHKMSLNSAFFACFLGIGFGDMALYLIGYVVSRFNMESRPLFKKYKTALIRLKKSEFLTYSILISRLIPGTRLPTYLGAGFLHYSIWKFTALTFASVFIWVGAALLAGKSLQAVFMEHWILAFLSFLTLVGVFKVVVPKFLDSWDRKALLHAWRKWLDFEFWPAGLFYIPLVFYYIYLSCKHRSLFMPFYANPHVAHGGLIGESKWDFLQFLNPSDPSTLPTVRVRQDLDFLETKKTLANEGISYPFIIKPDVGQRGFGVRILRNDFELTEYLLLGDFEKIIQKLSVKPYEAGLFYVRMPFAQQGHIFSVTDKRFPFLVGDGKFKLGDLILQDRRARVIAPTYFARLRDRLDWIPARDEKVPLSECGNHCQGAIFLNGKDLITESLTQEVDRITRQIPDFYFGRLDVRYESAELLKQGKNFEIVEINGAGAEATHIWDAKTTLIEAYTSLFTQWSLLFEIGEAVKLRPENKNQLHLFAFLKECAKVAFRKEALSVSS